MVLLYFPVDTTIQREGVKTDMESDVLLRFKNI